MGNTMTAAAAATDQLTQAFAKAEREWNDLMEGATPLFLVGAATCGRAAGAGDTMARLRSELASQGLEYPVIEVGCLGPCSLEPLVIVAEPGGARVCYGGVGPDEASRLLHEHVIGGKPCVDLALGWMGEHPVEGVPRFEDHPMMRGQQRIVTGNCGLTDPENPAHYVARGGFRGFLRALEIGADATLEQVKLADLRGRGGAGFPTFLKWTFCRDAPGEPKYLICNADEGDPGAFMNRSLLEGDPLAVLEGMLIAGFTLGASQGYVYCRAEYPLAIRRLDLGIRSLRELGLLGENIQGSGFSFDLEIKIGAGAFVCGEETALIASVAGKRGMPRPRPPFPAVEGLFGKPTVIQNVETLGNLPLILRNGAEWYRQRGTKSSRGTKTFALAGNIERKGLIEVPMGITLREIVYDIGGGIPEGKKLKAVQTGGPSGGCIPADMMDLPVDYEKLAEAGSIMGSGGMIVVDEDTCVVDLAKFFLAFSQDESCGKCTTCRLGTRVLLQLLEKISSGQGTMADLDQLEAVAGQVSEGSLCGLGKTSPNPVLTTLKYFRREYEEHVVDKACKAFRCTQLIEYHIDQERCVGCGACAPVCPTDAIWGEKRQPFSIVPELCENCGACVLSCPPAYAAIYMKSGDAEQKLPQKRRKSA